MMFDARSARVWIWSRPIDFRIGMNGLSALGENPYCGDVFVFRSKRRDRLKLLAFDGSGMILATKWLEEAPSSGLRSRRAGSVSRQRSSRF